MTDRTNVMTISNVLLQAKRQQKKKKRAGKRRFNGITHLTGRSKPDKPLVRLASCQIKIKHHQQKHDSELIRVRWHFPLLDFLRRQKVVLD